MLDQAQNMPSDRYDLARFVDAQRGIYERARAELQRGRKQSHWMWFIFPQMRGLGSSATSMRFGISSAAEARAYLSHPVLGPRLCECTECVLALEERSVAQIFGHPDDLKFHSSMTLFAHIAGDSAPFAAALERYFAGAQDTSTLKLLDDS